MWHAAIPVEAVTNTCPSPRCCFSALTMWLSVNDLPVPAPPVRKSDSPRKARSSARDCSEFSATAGCAAASAASAAAAAAALRRRRAAGRGFSSTHRRMASPYFRTLSAPMPGRATPPSRPRLRDRRKRLVVEDDVRRLAVGEPHARRLQRCTAARPPRRPRARTSSSRASPKRPTRRRRRRRRTTPRSAAPPPARARAAARARASSAAAASSSCAAPAGGCDGGGDAPAPPEAEPDARPFASTPTCRRSPPRARRRGRLGRLVSVHVAAWRSAWWTAAVAAVGSRAQPAERLRRRCAQQRRRVFRAGASYARPQGALGAERRA